jgi:hypothetical protein
MERIFANDTSFQSEAKSRVPSKAELAAAEAARRDEALASSTLDPSNKGFKMMTKLGFKPGSALGKQPSPKPSDGASGSEASNGNVEGPRTEPINVIVKEGRGGIGLDSEKKRKFREETEQESKRVKAEEGDFRERVRLEREEKRTENLVRAAQKVAERLDAEAENANGDDNMDNIPTAEEKRKKQDRQDSEERSEKATSSKPISQVNILYRGLVRSREENLRDLRIRRGLYDSLSSRPPTLPSANPDLDPDNLPTYSDPTLTRDDEIALGQGPVPRIRGPSKPTLEEEEVEEEDPELEEFNALDPWERLKRLVAYLRERYRYCFWCKFRYEDEEMEGCPGLTEDDHD